MENKQSILSQVQIESFHHENFVKSQVDDFIRLCGQFINTADGKVIDIGGGCGYFAKALQSITSFQVRVVDSNEPSIEYCNDVGIDGVIGDALKPNIIGDERIVCFNLILHHLVGKTSRETQNLQRSALSVWLKNCQAVFVNEYIYESYFLHQFSGWIIFKITSNSFLSNIGRVIAKFMPSLNANTFGVGVRFRSHAEWVSFFELIGFDVIDVIKGKQEEISIPRRLLFIKNCRRDSFLLQPRADKLNII